ncbi:MAG: NCS2 family permease [Bdellovibrionales bacterium]|nr:NCS2 family permease [Bdellovibrionales bacterium]
MKAIDKSDWIGGLTTFFTMSYIVVVNPAILSTHGTGLSFSGVMTATVLLCFLMTALMGLYAKLPFAVAPGMGINAFFTYSIILGRGIAWPTALGMVFWSGFLFLLISITPLREKIAQSIPASIRIASAGGIGIFLSFIGLQNAHFLESDPVTLVHLAKLDHRAGLGILGLAVIVILSRKKNPLAFIAGILTVTLGAAFMGKIEAPKEFLSLPDFESVFLKLDLVGSLKPALIPAIVSILFTDLFDSLSTLIGVSHATGLVDEKGEPKNLRQGLLVDSLATMLAGPFGTSAGTAYIESSAGIEAGGRSGMASVVTALCFLPCFFLAPILGLIPSYATAPVLVMVGAMMFRSVLGLTLSGPEELIPAFLTLILIPFTFSITQGILWGIFSYVTLHLLAGKRSSLSPMLIGIGCLSGVLLLMESGDWLITAILHKSQFRQ